MLILGNLEHLQELWQADPLATLTSALAHLAGSIMRAGLALLVGGLSNGQVGLTIAVGATV